MNHEKTLIVRVAGVTFEGRQDVIAQLKTTDAIKLIPEPNNPHDAYAIGVWVGAGETKRHIGYIPHVIALQIAQECNIVDPVAEIKEIIGGFSKWDGSQASLGVVLSVRYRTTHK